MNTATVAQAAGDQEVVPVLLESVSSFLSGLRGVHAAKEQCFLEGSPHLPVHGLLLLPSVPDTSEDHEDHDHPQEHHLGGNVLCRQAQLRGSDVK